MTLATNLQQIRHRNGLRLALRDAVQHGDTEAADSLRAELETEEALDRAEMRDTFLRRRRRE